MTGTNIVPKFGFVMDNAGPQEVGTNKPEKHLKVQYHILATKAGLNFMNTISMAIRIIKFTLITFRT